MVGFVVFTRKKTMANSNLIVCCALSILTKIEALKIIIRDGQDYLTIFKPVFEGIACMLIYATI